MLRIYLLAAGFFLVSSGVIDFRKVSYEELMTLEMERFSQPGVSYYTELLFDIPRYQLIIGARNSLFRVSLEEMTKLEEAPWLAPENNIKTCIQKGQSKEDCQNFIRVLLLHNGKIFACGTNAFSPRCSWRDVNTLNNVTEWVSGIAKCPYNPHQNSTVLMTAQGDYYIASAVDFSGQDHAIYRIMGKNPMLRTVQYDPKWLSGPHFIASYEVENFTYFFFRENAIEYINCGKVVYSRVARVCKNDHGGQFVLKDSWTTFLKARLNCSIPGQYPFYFNEIQSIHYLEREQMFYASFTTNENSIYGSAICAYNMSSIHDAFNGPFKYQKNPTTAWVREANGKKHFQCEAAADSQSIVDSEKYQLMDDVVQPIVMDPIFNVELERLSLMVVDVVATKHDEGVHVIFVVNVEGVIRKLAVSPNTYRACLIEEIYPFPPNATRPTIHIMKLLKDTNSLYLGTQDGVVRIPFHRCQRFKTKIECLNSMDPYCGWNEYQVACTTAPRRNPLSTFWHQQPIGCPQMDAPVNGNWGPWSSWFECSQAGNNPPGDKCLCRQRECSNPTPANGGKPCEGIKYQVTNCTQNGQWSEWSSWSSCTQSCGLAVKTRRRTCGNPAPAHGGLLCVGVDRDELYCTSNPPCPALSLPSVDGQWSEWSRWEECSVPCGGGIQARQRKCNSPLPQNGGNECLGCNQDFRHCNTHECPEIKKSTNWTPWLKLNITRDGYFEQRFRFSCRANVPNPNAIRIGHMKKEERFCLEGGQSCLDAAFANIDGNWSEWSDWSECSVSCGGGNQYRERSCDNPAPSGTGHDCKDVSKMTRDCNTEACKDVQGWKEWSEWSKCDKEGGQWRERICENPNNLSQCHGMPRERRMCVPGQVGMVKDLSVSGSVGVGYVVTAGLFCFIFGCLAGAAAAYFYLKRSGGVLPAGLGKLNKTPVENIYVDERINNFNVNGSPSKNAQQATIKRQKSLRTNFQDNNF